MEKGMLWLREAAVAAEQIGDENPSCSVRMEVVPVGIRVLVHYKTEDPVKFYQERTVSWYSLHASPHKANPLIPALDTLVAEMTRHAGK